VEYHLQEVCTRFKIVMLEPHEVYASKKILKYKIKFLEHPIQTLKMKQQNIICWGQIILYCEIFLMNDHSI